jgi:hypothetical protein
VFSGECSTRYTGFNDNAVTMALTQTAKQLSLHPYHASSTHMNVPVLSAHLAVVCRLPRRGWSCPLALLWRCGAHSALVGSGGVVGVACPLVVGVATGSAPVGGLVVGCGPAHGVGRVHLNGQQAASRAGTGKRWCLANAHWLNNATLLSM